jgi:GGDEF domain-containing protein
LDYDLIKVHAYAGYEILSKIMMYKDLAEIIRHHHERYDGQGYPDRLQGEEIPLLSRILTVADAFDAMTTNRIYKPRKEIPQALQEMQDLAGRQFHPDVVKAAVKVLASVEIPSTISQLPTTDLEKSRFSYFFNDRLTGLYNEDYLQFVLQSNRETSEFKCLTTAHLQNLPEYNARHGWQNGNQLVQKFAQELRRVCPNTMLFRAYGNDFVLIPRQHEEIERDTLQAVDCLQGTDITVETYHVDLLEARAYTVDKLDRLRVFITTHGDEKRKII